MLSQLRSGFLGVSLLLSLAACDAGRSDLDEEVPGGEGSPPEQLEGSCSAIVDGRQFVADVTSARVDAEGTLDFSCADGPVEILFRLEPEQEGPATLPLGVPGNRVRYSVGQDVTISVEPAGVVVLDTYTPGQIVGAFQFTVPGFEEDDDPIRVTFGEFDIEMR
jgi:hypothetical protein